MNVKLVSMTNILVDGIDTPEELIVYIARVSSPNNQLNMETAPKLIRYLIQNKHWSPFEMVNICFEIETSRAISHQLVRHKSFSFQEFCISGDSIITLKLPSGAPYKRKISDIYKLQRFPNQHIKRNGLPLARVFDGEKFVVARIKEVFYTGIKPVFRITLSNKKTITCTKEHKFLTADGYDSLENIVGLAVTNKTASMSKTGIVATNGVQLHQNYNWMLNAKKRAIENKTGVKGIAAEAGVSYHTIRKWLRIHKLQFTGKESASTYDVWNKGLFGYKIKPHTLQTIEKMRASAKRGKDSNLWKGGVDRAERVKIGDWCATIRAQKLIENNYCCVQCGSKHKLELDHILPVYSHPELAYTYSNIQTLCQICHNNKHNLSGDQKVWTTKRRKNTLTVTWATIEKIEYAGEQETYDIEVDHPAQNYVANGIIVHNSQRYSEVEDFEPIELRKQAIKNRQSSSDIINDKTLQDNVDKTIKACFACYELLLEQGVARETARMVLPLTTKTRLFMNGSLRSWIHFLDVRNSEHAQKEIRLIAQEIENILKQHFPNTFEALT